MPENPYQGEVWRVRLDPGIDAEMGKTRPCVVISSPLIGRLPLFVIVPITDWKESACSTSLIPVFAPSPARNAHAAMQTDSRSQNVKGD